ncbi:hypothetical protein GG851_23615 [Bordetella petrii]|nr:hypothetical protein [Bordetella petrii]
MPLLKMLLQFLALWTFVFPAGLFAAAWYNLSDTLVTYSLLLIALPLVVSRFPATQQRPFSHDEQFPAVVGLTAIILAINLTMTTLFTPSGGGWLDPPLPLNVIQGFIALQTPLYGVMSWLFIRTANVRFLARRARLAVRAPVGPQSGNDENARPTQATGQHRIGSHRI